MMASKASGRRRLDLILVERELVGSRAKAQALILAGRVRSEGRLLDKPGVRHPADLPLEIAESRRYVSRGGHKLADALLEFSIELEGRDTLDVGASTGGFTQVLLEAGAGRVIALDVGRGQLDWSLRNDPRVHVMEGCNARYLEASKLPYTPSLAVIDVAFISLELILPAVVPCLAEEADVIALVKPQFEVGRHQVGRGGIVRDPSLHLAALDKISTCIRSNGWGVQAFYASPLLGADGNREFLVHFKPRLPGLEGAALSESLQRALEQESEEDGA
jgi:23S rRNA (cytidine1920-2'-O)/16S rRNA (cytidine1409-2'-O)-methyltransferase